MSNDMDTESAFREFHAELIGLTVDQHRRYLHVEPCDCDHPDCIGWATIPVTQMKRERREQRRELPSFVYFAKLGGLIKIGHSRDVALRMRNLNAELIGQCEGGRLLERELHREFADLRERYEWFRSDPRLLERIEELCA